MVYLNERGVKGFVTVNVLVFDEELESVEKLIRHIATCGADAVIVQVGRAMSPYHPKHTLHQASSPPFCTLHLICIAGSAMQGSGAEIRRSSNLLHFTLGQLYSSRTCILAYADRIVTVASAHPDVHIFLQDLGVVDLIRRVAPGLPVHGSTQMTITSPEGSEYAEQLGLQRVVLGRELSVDEIVEVTSASNAEVEVFVHGALCVSYR